MTTLQLYIIRHNHKLTFIIFVAIYLIIHFPDLFLNTIYAAEFTTDILLTYTPAEYIKDNIELNDAKFMVPQYLITDSLLTDLQTILKSRTLNTLSIPLDFEIEDQIRKWLLDVIESDTKPYHWNGMVKVKLHYSLQLEIGSDIEYSGIRRLNKDYSIEPINVSIEYLKS